MRLIGRISILIWSVSCPLIGLASEEFAGQITSVAVGDINQDGWPDSAIIMAPLDENSQDDNSLAIYLGDSYEGTISLKEYLPNFVWGANGPFVGNRASVEINKRGSILVKSHNEAIGRHRWSQTITLVLRDDRILVAGFTYSSYDTIENDQYSNCDYNILTGKGVKEQGENARVEIDKPGQRIDAVDWHEQTQGDPCDLFE